MFTFDPCLSTYRDLVRLLTQDTDPATMLLADETINALVTTLGFAPALAQICDTLIARYANEPDYLQEHLGIEVRWSKRIDAWEELASRARAGMLRDPFASTQTSHNAALKHTHIQEEKPGFPLPSVTLVPGAMGGFRA